MNISFANIHNFGNVIIEDELIQHYHFPEMLNYYSGNFITFKRMPSIDEFKETADCLKNFHLKNGQNHLLFYFPEGEYLDEELQQYLKANDYDFSYNELYKIHPNDFPSFTKNPNIVVETVKLETLDTFLQLQYNLDLEFGIEFAKGKQMIHKTNFYNENWKQVIAFYQGTPAGTLDLIVSEKTVEIDNFTLLESFRKKGIGKHMQKYVMEQYPNHTVILVAEGEGTAREMYRKQNYQFVSFQYEALIIF
ncbi:GNAT family N-acetyltransferase [Pallidibacillus pasinlerensis]|uniref:GNAT family N-acetyltransferase n=1 Tax=Pallidibacillus pasinlerensis TaxID=2703818 RepID=A0ABX0A2U7_9BACI|nr:GNAT family N-acetyltransferase [Pallidibacillus pasinlerensis]NCU17763.1 GNAT family N-acetyltransferase [Pallidibacillus pasinlerensis]